jgi:hypothetical protein
VKDKDQVNLTDEDSRIMKVAGGGFDQCYNAQAVVATGSMLIVATEVTQAANDKEQLMPMIEKLQALPKELGRAKRILADSGYLSQAQRRAMRGGQDRAADRDGSALAIMSAGSSALPQRRNPRPTRRQRCRRWRIG